MSTCKDCLHFEVCEFNDGLKKWCNPDYLCPHFKNKADYVEVKYGKWLKTKEPLGWQDVDCVECSVCHESWVIDDNFDFDDYSEYYKFCPNCGAKMKGGAE